MKRIFFSILMFFLTLSAGSLLFFYVQRRSRLMIICTSLDDSIRPQDRCLMNPFRDKQPEIEAEKILQELKSGNPEILLPLLKDFPTEIQNHFLENERKYKIDAWRIGSRGQLENKMALT